MDQQQENPTTIDLETRLQVLENELRQRNATSFRRRKWILASTLLLFLTWTGLAVSDILPSLDDLHVFSANTPARAGEVNDNFDTVRHHISTNANTKLNNSGDNTYTGNLTVNGNGTYTGDLAVGGDLTATSLALSSNTLTVDTLAANHITFQRENCDLYYISTTHYYTIVPPLEYRSNFIQCPDGMFVSGVYQLTGTRVGGSGGTETDIDDKQVWAVNCCNF